MLSNSALRKALAKYDALISSTVFSSYGYWEVTFSCAPGLAMTVMVCDTYIDQRTAIDQAGVTLSEQTGQRVRYPS